MKFLCICDGGNVRSVAMAQYIKELSGTGEGFRGQDNLIHEAIAIGEPHTGKETVKMMKVWADYIIDVREYLPLDLWHNPRHPELKEEVKKIWKQLEEKHHFV